MPMNDMVFLPSTYHQSPSASETTWGARSPSSGTRPSHKSGGSMMCESDEIIHVVASSSATDPVGAVIVMVGSSAYGIALSPEGRSLVSPRARALRHHREGLRPASGGRLPHRVTDRAGTGG